MSEVENKGEGDLCPSGCGGKLGYVSHSGNGCSCHINPPCSSCTDQDLACEKCGEIAVEFTPPVISEYKPNIFLTTNKTADERFNELKDGVFGSVRYPNDGWGMAVKGKMAQGTTRDEVLRLCGVCEYGCPFFKQFGNGTFLLTYNYN